MDSEGGNTHTHTCTGQQSRTYGSRIFFFFHSSEQLFMCMCWRRRENLSRTHPLIKAVFTKPGVLNWLIGALLSSRNVLVRLKPFPRGCFQPNLLLWSHKDVLGAKLPSFFSYHESFNLRNVAFLSLLAEHTRGELTEMNSWEREKL